MTTMINMPSPPISTRSSSVSEDSEEEFGLTSYRKDIYGYPSLLSPASTRSSYTEEEEDDMCTCKPSDVCASCRFVDDITEPMSPRKLMSPRKKALSDPTPLARKTMNKLQQKLAGSMSPDAMTRGDNKEIDSTLVSMIAENLPTWVVPARDPKGKPIDDSIARNNHQINYLTDIPHVHVPNGLNQGSTGTICNQQTSLRGNHSRFDNWQDIKNKFKAVEHQYTKFELPLHFNSSKIPQPPSEYVDTPAQSPTESLDLSYQFYPVVQNNVDAAANATYKAPYSQRWQNGSQSMDSTPTPSDNKQSDVWPRTTSDLPAKQHPTCNIAPPLSMPSKPLVDTWTTPFVTCRDDNSRIPPMQPLNAPQPNSQPSMAKSRRGSNLGNNATQRGHIRDDTGKNYHINGVPTTDKKCVNTVENNGINVARNKIIQEKSSAEIEKEQKKATLYKTEMCRNWEEKGDCRYGVKCQFAHSATELREVKKHPKYKTEICKTFWEKGSCPYGQRCCFIHNEKNLMPHSSSASLRAFTDAYFSGSQPAQGSGRRRLPCFTNLTR